MGQQQYKTGDGQSMQEKVATPDQDRAKVSNFAPKTENNDALKFKGKPSPLSKPV